MENVMLLKWAASCQNQQCGCAPSEDSDQPGHLPSLIRVFAVRMNKAWILSYPLNAQRRLWSDWADAQADLSLCCAHSHFVGFVMRRLKFEYCCLFYHAVKCPKDAEGMANSVDLKQCRPWSDCSKFKLFAHAYLSQMSHVTRKPVSGFSTR